MLRLSLSSPTQPCSNLYAIYFYVNITNIVQSERVQLSWHCVLTRNPKARRLATRGRVQLQERGSKYIVIHPSLYTRTAN